MKKTILITILTFLVVVFVSPKHAAAADYSKVVIFVQGLGTSLDPLGREDTFNTIKSSLLSQGFVQDQFVEFSYNNGFFDKSDNWHPYSYSCGATGKALDTSVNNLINLINLYRQKHPATKISLVGHSLGGLLGVRSLQGVVNGQIGTEAVDSVISLDSPLRGIPQRNVNLFQTFLDCPLLMDSQISTDLINLYLNVNTTGLYNASLVTQSGIPVYTLGNNQDCIYNTKECFIPGIDWTSSQKIMSANWTMYDLGNDVRNLDLGHKRILDDADAVANIVSDVVNP